MSIKSAGFEILVEDKNSWARKGLLKTTHGTIETPVFCPVGTAGAVKGLTPAQLEETGCSLILANTYHLMLRPGIETIEKLGGIHKFMAWQGPILTDSGGFQLFSLSELVQIDDDGIEFSSHIDGQKLKLDAKNATEIQNRLGADIIMCLDECPAFGCEGDKLKKAVQRTIKWAEQCKQAHSNPGQMLLGIVQGGTDEQLRSFCSKELIKMDFDGYAIGGLGIGEGNTNMIRTVSATTRLLPTEKPRYLMGVGMPADIITAVREGVDIFDCVLPTRNGRNGYAFTNNGPLRIRNSSNIEDSNPVEENCDCYCCRNFSRGAVRHFFNASEMLGAILLSVHNIRFYQRLMAAIREAIEKKEFNDWAQRQIKNDKYSETQKT
jgi:queuine tRNA-ribosyltransferase